jgi:DNA-directed RNA polymerase specialized sigma24 family protein
MRRGGAETESELPRLSVSATARQPWTLTQAAFDQFLQSLDTDRERAGEKYQEIRNSLMRLFEWRGCPFPEDHADETINRAARRIAEGEKVREPSSYCFGVARLLVLEIHKRSVKENRALNNLPDTEQNSTDRSDSESRSDCLRHCLKSLLPAQRELVITYYQGEKSNKIKNRKKLSERLQVSINTLRMRVLRLREQLEACVEDCLDGKA